jgi:hypothetical protein
MSRILTIAAITAGVLLFAGCKEDSTTASQGEGVLNGIVTDASTLSYLADVTVTAQSVSAGSISTTTDANGSFRASFSTDSLATATVTLRKTGYRDTTIVVSLKAGAVLVLPIAMTPKSIVTGSGGSSSGLAQTIAFLGASPQEVSVYGVGGKETSVLSFEARDSLGLAIDASHAIKLTFTSTNGPGGGEYISPDVVTTNAAGQAYTTFNAGTRSGVVQVTATATVGTRTITSSPVRFVINGGFPVQSHFSIAPNAHNFTALHKLGEIQPITVLAGDMYSNPVAPGTAVYFRSSAGVVQPSVFTDKNGFGTVNLYSGNPLPLTTHAAPVYGDGYHWVVARTLGQGGTVVQDSTLILWSGNGVISNISPLTFDIPNAGSQAFSFRVSDELGHPLSEGTIISVSALIPPPPSEGIQQNQVTTVFGSNGAIKLQDVIFSGPGATDFTFILKDGTWSITDPTPVNIVINVTGPNVTGSIGYTFGGTVR